MQLKQQWDKDIRLCKGRWLLLMLVMAIDVVKSEGMAAAAPLLTHRHILYSCLVSLSGWNSYSISSLPTLMI